MKAMNVHCVSQSIFLKELGKNFEQYLEDERLHRCYPYRSVLNAGINLSLSSDAPVVKDFNPITGIKAALFRKDADGNTIGPDEKINSAEALYAYTMGSAKANNNEQEVGSIEKNKKADFIILNKKLGNQVSEDEEIKVCETYINGEILYQHH